MFKEFLNIEYGYNHIAERYSLSVYKIEKGWIGAKPTWFPNRNILFSYDLYFISTPKIGYVEELNTKPWEYNIYTVTWYLCFIILSLNTRLDKPSVVEKSPFRYWQDHFDSKDDLFWERLNEHYPLKYRRSLYGR